MKKKEVEKKTNNELSIPEKEILNGMQIIIEGRLNFYGEAKKSNDPFYENYIVHLLYTEVENKISVLKTFLSSDSSTLSGVDEKGDNLWHHIIMLKNNHGLHNTDKYKNIIDAYRKELNEFGRVISKNNRTIHTMANDKGETPMELAFNLRDFESMQVLFGIGENPNIVLSNTQRTLFAEALASSNISVVKELMQKPALKMSKEDVKEVFMLSKKEESLSALFRPYAIKKIESEGRLKVDQSVVKGKIEERYIKDKKTTSIDQQTSVNNNTTAKTKSDLTPIFKSPHSSALYPIPQVDEATIKGIQDGTILNSKAKSETNEKMKEKKPLPPLPTIKREAKAVPAVPTKAAENMAAKVAAAIPTKAAENMAKVAPAIPPRKNSVIQQSFADLQITSSEHSIKGIVSKNREIFQKKAEDNSFGNKVMSQRNQALQDGSKKR